MPRQIELTLTRRNVTCTAELLDDLAPRTCEAIWEALPQEGDAFHAKYASNEVYTLVPPFADPPLPLENPTMTPITGDLLYFYFTPGLIPRPDVRAQSQDTGLVDLAIFYGRDNLLISPQLGPIQGCRFGSVTENLEAMVEACDSIWREGFAGERLRWTRVE